MTMISRNVEDTLLHWQWWFRIGDCGIYKKTLNLNDMIRVLTNLIRAEFM